MSGNKLIIQTFEQLLHLRISQGEVWRSKAYANVLPRLKALDWEIKSEQDAKKIDGIGDRMAKKIGEILHTGTLSELKVKDPKADIIRLFTSVEQVGPVKALKWYDLGYRTLKDIPLFTCTKGQRLGIELHSDLIQPIPRREVGIIGDFLNQYVGNRSSIKIDLAGSYRRGRPTSGDIDVLVTSTLPNALDIFMFCPILTHVLSKGPKKLLGICKIGSVHRRIDFELTDPITYPYALLYFTGSRLFEVKIRTYCLERNLKLTEQGLFDEINQRKFIVKDEKDIFFLLRLKYLSPEERENPPPLIQLL